MTRRFPGSREKPSFSSSVGKKSSNSRPRYLSARWWRREFWICATDFSALSSSRPKFIANFYFFTSDFHRICEPWSCRIFWRILKIFRHESPTAECARNHKISVFGILCSMISRSDGENRQKNPAFRFSSCGAPRSSTFRYFQKCAHVTSDWLFCKRVLLIYFGIAFFPLLLILRQNFWIRPGEVLNLVVWQHCHLHSWISQTSYLLECFY